MVSVFFLTFSWSESLYKITFHFIKFTMVVLKCQKIATNMTFAFELLTNGLLVSH